MSPLGETGSGETQPLSHDLAFFGAITARVSHELNNVVSIIQQVIGLLEDQLYAADQGAPLDPEKLRSIHDRVVRQSERGEDIIHSLNRFAHSIDQADQTFELNGVLSSLQVLCTRFAELKRVQFEIIPASDIVQLNGSPFLLHQALFWLLRAALEQAREGETLEISTISTEPGEIVLSYAGAGVGQINLSQPAVQQAVELIMDFGGELDVAARQDGGPELWVTLPAHILPGDI